MRVVLVNDRTPFRKTFCLQCCEPIGSGYVREIGTRIPFCDYECYSLHRDFRSLLESGGRTTSSGAASTKAVGKRG